MVSNTYIGTQTWSDHAPVIMTLTSPLYRSREHTWRLNTSLLTDPMLRADIDEALKQYFEINTTPEVSPHTIWAAHKATIRGLLIAKATARKRDRKTEITSLLDEIQTLETSHKTDQSALLYQQLLDSRKRLNDLLQADIRFQAVKTRAFFALQENKPGRLLARLLRKRQEQSYVPHIRLRNNALTTRPDEILQEFVRYYTDLYNGRGETPTPDLLPRIADYLKDNVARRLTETQAASLEDPILQEELVATLKHIKNNKCPGPDGFPAEYYKTFAKTLSSPMLTMFNATREGSKFSHHALTATIAVIPKPDKDLTECKHFRPISLLNGDVKILARILADRLKRLLPTLIGADQVGFVPGREARDATTRVLNAIALSSGGGHGLLLLSTDAEKAFDRVGWPFLFQTLEAFGLPAHFLHWIRSLYDSPTARVRVNGALSVSFPISNGTRQGCPLSPLLFALFLEPFLEAIRRDDRIQGIQGMKHTHKVSAYADDLLFLLPHPRTSMPHLLEHFKIFGELSGYKINNDKSNMLSLDMSTTDVSFVRSRFPFQWCASRLKYLGIWISHTQEGTYKHNYGQLLQDFRLNLSSWTHLPISWLGRVSVLKMNVMPRLLYTLQALPILLPRTFFKELDSIFLAFIWPKGRPRVKIHLLRRPRLEGGLALPDAKLYFYAAQLTRMLDWMSETSDKLWLDLEEQQARRPLWTAPWLPTQLLRHGLPPSSLYGDTLSVWWRIRGLFGLSPSLSPLMPLQHHPDFSPGLESKLIRRFTDGSRLFLFQVLQDDVVGLPGRSDDTTELSFGEHFALHRLRHFVNSLPKGFRPLRQLTPFENFCRLALPLSKSISTIYALLQKTDASLPPLCGRWETILGLEFTPETWHKTLYLTLYGSRAFKVTETSYKLLTFWYYTPHQTAHFSLSCDSICWRCGLQTGTYLHIWWSCTKITPYWRMIGELVTEITDLILPFTPEVYLLLHLPGSQTALRNSVALHLVLAARRLIPARWRSSAIPSIRDWAEAVEHLRTVDDLAARHSENMNPEHLTKWYYWDRFRTSSTFRQRLLPRDNADRTSSLSP
uniref:Reverse transcriptase domain-containing protein n=1 Tax=Leptobrachium leishanense TaxID=445787 RepID=A0A8C5QKB6_9ANUR